MAGHYDSTIVNLEQASAKNDFHNDVISNISVNTNLSTIAIYTRLLINNKISQSNYRNVYNDILESIKKREKELQLERDREKRKAELEGRKLGGATPK